MLVYANYPVAHTSIIFEALAKKSEDPLKQVVCIAFDKRTNMVHSYGVNRIIGPLRLNSDALKAVKTDKHPAKKFLMIHAEIDMLEKIKHTHAEHKKHLRIYVSTQPCMNCLNQIIDAGFTDVQWLDDNRHQDEQKLIASFMKVIKYEKNTEGYMLQTPPWVVEELEIEKIARDRGLL